MENRQRERYRNLGLNIAYYRKLRGFSQEKLAEQVNISRTHMSRIETADCAVSLDVVFNLADALAVEPYKLFQNKE
ncbi:MAG: helix-turn-helix transcriptional regulator [Oscillibacter sp.]|nr:helix-turn-helix transcriptional regulator [Oscillibacter sp.]